MKKIILSILLICLFCISLTACNIIGGNDNNNNNNNSSNSGVNSDSQSSFTQTFDVNSVVFGQTKFVYSQGKTYSIEIVSIPNGYHAVATNNEQSQVGEYTVVFKFYNENDTLVGEKNVTLTITKTEEVILPYL